MKKVYWSGGKHSDSGKGGWYSIIDDDTCTELEKKNVIKREDYYYICLDSKSFKEIAKNALADDEAGKFTEENVTGFINEGYVDSSTGLYSNPGQTLKGIAKAVFIIGSILFAVIGIIVGNLGWDFNVGLFLGILVAGILISYLGGLGLAALGDLVMNTNEINRKLK